MATETLLSLNCPEGFPYENLPLLLNSDLHPQLKRNIHLLIAQYKTLNKNMNYENIYQQEEIWNELLDIDYDEDYVSLFDTNEPEIIRELYYSDNYPDLESDPIDSI